MPFIASVRGSYGAQGRFGRALGLSASTGGTITTAGGYRIHTFLFADSGTNFVQSGTGNVEYLVIAGGGGGGSISGGGGGAGGYRTGTLSSHAAGTYAVTVGNGGAFGATAGKAHNSTSPFDNSGTQGTNGGNSVFSSITSTGGGGGGGAYDDRNPGPSAIGNGLPGGSGGGGGTWGSGGGGGAGSAGATYTAMASGPQYQTTAGAGIGGQGNPGGNGRTSWDGPGAFPGGIYGKGDGGAGSSSSITGSAVTRAGGGGGGGHNDGHTEPGVGGSGVGGTRGRNAVDGIAAVQNTGSGGGGGQPSSGSTAINSGANGIVVVRYLQ